MSSETSTNDDDTLRSEYGFSKGEQGKHYRSYKEGTNVVFLEPDVAKVFTDSDSVNKALRLVLQLAKDQAADR
jgi:hypothetical protein